jgi:hypothetical protein
MGALSSELHIITIRTALQLEIRIRSLHTNQVEVEQLVVY